jgi:RimJ/RimL family protein N-acetyltransferase
MASVPEADHPTLVTPHLRLRPWRDDDLPAFAALNADPAVMGHFPAPLDRARSDAEAAYVSDHFARHGFGFWAVEIPGVADFAGFVGLLQVGAPMPFAPAVEIGWRLARPYWSAGYATKGPTPPSRSASTGWASTRSWPSRSRGISDPAGSWSTWA